jgi:hypothetical protein
MIPAKIIVVAQGQYGLGLAVLLRFRMVEKNDYSFIVFLDAGGRKEVSQAELLREFERTATFSPMDYVNAQGGFTGVIDAKVMSKEEIEGALGTHEMFKKDWKYPPDYFGDLKRALTVNPASNCLIAVERVSLDCAG